MISNVCQILLETFFNQMSIMFLQLLLHIALFVMKATLCLKHYLIYKYQDALDYSAVYEIFVSNYNSVKYLIKAYKTNLYPIPSSFDVDVIFCGIYRVTFFFFLFILSYTLPHIELLPYKCCL